MSEWSVFSDEGQIADFGTREAAEAYASELRADGDPHAYAGPECRDHEGQCSWHCELCNAEAEDENVAERARATKVKL
jgi:hypothetical protein